MTIYKDVGNTLTFNVTPTGGAPSGVNYNIVLYKVLSTGIRTDLKTFLNVPLNNRMTYIYNIPTEDIGITNYKTDVKYTCPTDGTIKMTTSGYAVTVSPTMTATLSINPNTITVGQQVTFTVNVNGGSSPFNYNWN